MEELLKKYGLDIVYDGENVKSIHLTKEAKEAGKQVNDQIVKLIKYLYNYVKYGKA